MRLDNFAASRSAGEVTLSAELGGLPIWYRFPEETPVTPRADPFIVAALMPAMAANEPIEVTSDLAVSPRLLRGIEVAQEILHGWFPGLRKVEILAPRQEAESRPRQRTSAVFFSGGVDGTYTALRHAGEITQLILLHGLEITLANETLFEQAVKSCRATADLLGKQLVTVTTNVRELAARHGISNHLYQGAILGSVALALGFRRMYVGATFTTSNLIPWGSHPQLDPLWSSETSELVHDGIDARRSEKIARIAERPELLASLRVCLSNSAEYNCGRCSKCLRTMTTLRLLGLTSPSLPPMLSTWPIRRLVVARASERIFLEDNLDLARQVGDRAMTRALESCLRRARRLERLRAWDARVLGGRLRRVFLRLRGRRETLRFDC